MSEEKELEMDIKSGSWELRKERNSNGIYKLKKRICGNLEMTFRFDDITELESWGWVLFELNEEKICWYPKNRIPNEIIEYFSKNEIE